MTSIEKVKKYLFDACEILGEGSLPTQLQTIIAAHMICLVEQQCETDSLQKRMTETAENMYKSTESRLKKLEEKDDDEPKVN